MADRPSIVRDVSDVVQLMTYCSTADADDAAAKICQSPETLGRLAKACGLRTAEVGAGGAVIVLSAGVIDTGVGAPIGLAGVGAGFVLAADGATKARVYCRALISHGTASLSTAVVESLSSILK